MSTSFARSPFMPCPDCGASVAVADHTQHVCDPERRLDYEMFRLRGDVALVETEIDAYLASPEGRFAKWCAERERTGGQEPPAEDERR